MRRYEKTVRLSVDHDHTIYGGRGSLEEVKADIPLDHVPALVEICMIGDGEVQDPKGRDQYQPQMVQEDRQGTSESGQIKAVAPR